MHTSTAPGLRFATLLMLLCATCAQATRSPQVKPLPRGPRDVQRYVQAQPCLRDVPDLSRYSLENARAVIAKYGFELAGVATRPQPVESELVVEWRALTVALVDELADRVRALLSVRIEALPLAAVLEGGTWAAGRELARAKRGGEPPLAIVSDGTVF